MEKISDILNKKINHLAWVLIGNGVVMLMLSVLIVWTDFMLRFIMGLLAFVIGYVFLYGAYKVWTLKKLLDKYIKF